ncbi:hypothetical protein [Dietzia sp. PP-33]|jgi:hypothetical protein|uniref:hypothetical protein n=1 Tax=Dietzia sp. PP-33 TaxID=2957500 RepID=UPI0029BCC011|nr:hypothetical protein [Dietzia sp. PP-33]MDX2358367.1 hypothetical protein [Dietzia sp. PP-33]
MTPTWSDVGGLLARGADAEFEADLVVRPRTEPAPSVRRWVMDDPRANLHAGPGRSRLTRAGASRVRLDHAGGRQTLFNDGTVWQVAADETATRFDVRSLNASGYAALLIDQPDNAEQALGYGFPSGPLADSSHQGRPTVVAAGDPGDGLGAVEVSIDVHTGVLVKVAAADESWEAGLENLTFTQCDESVFRWEGETGPPEPIQSSAERIPTPFTGKLTAVPDPEPLPADRSGRQLRARLDELVIADGQLSPPRVGDTVEVHLTFFEDLSPMGAEPAEVRATAEPIGTGTPRKDHHGVLRWPTILRGDGWCARWSSPRPMIGHVLVTGHFAIIHDAAAVDTFPPTRAVVTGIRVNRLTGPMPADPEREPLPDNAWSDESECPAGFAPHMVQRNTDDYAYPIAVALDLDVDAAEPPQLRNDFEPGGLAVLDDELWASDRFRPILQRRRAKDSTPAVEHLLPLPVSRHPSRITPHVSAHGLWIEHEHTLYSVDTTRGDTAHLNDLGKVGWRSAVAIGRHLVTAGQHLRRFDADGEIDPVPLPPEIAYVGSLALVTEGLLVVGRELSWDDMQDAVNHRPDKATLNRFRLALYDHHGRWTVGPSFGLPRPESAVGRTEQGAWILCADLVIRFDASLTKTTAHRLPYYPGSGEVTESGMWLTLDPAKLGQHLRNSQTPDPWRLRDMLSDLRPRYQDSRGLVVRLDNNFDPVAAVLTDSHRPSAVVTPDDIVWFSGRSWRGITADGHIIDGQTATSRPAPHRL